MTRLELEHIIRAAASISGDDEIVIFGSQAILAQFPDAPQAMRRSIEAGVFPRNKPERWDLVDGSIGEGSMFHDTFGYYAQGVEERTAVLPAGWQQRLVPICNANTRGATGLALEVHDLLVSKIIAGRDKDVAFLREAAKHGLADGQVVLRRLDESPAARRVKEAARARILRAFGVTGQT